MLSFQISPHGLILDPATCSAFRSCLVSSLPILPHTLLLNITTCPFVSHHMPLMLSFEVLPHILLSFISCLVIFALSGLVTCTPLRPRDHMPYFKTSWPHALLSGVTTCPSFRSCLVPSCHVLTSAFPSHLATWPPSDHASCFQSGLASCPPFRSCHFFSSSCSWRVWRVSCSLILKMKLVPPSLPRSSYVPSYFWFIL